ncbi:hypothetical protein V491_00213 [Pseudogymnoascus sp. VKM F-3775]|nr:hypothetical protein V491_00213 [Pseudogymnoascus sp. VKM F-3775]
MSSNSDKPQVIQVEEGVTTPSDVDMEGLKATKTADTVHFDEALKVLQGYDGDQTTTIRLCSVKLDDLGLTTGNRYSFSASIFYLGYIVGAYPTMVLAQRYPVERVASILVVLWGICLILTVICTNYKGLYAQRFFLGFLESGISPLFMLIVGSWYKKNEQAFRMGIWYSCTGYVSIFSPLINYGFGKITSGPLPSWKYMYLFSGGITIVWGVAIWFVLPPDPIRTTIFNPRQRYIAVARMRSNNSGVRNMHFKKNQIVELLVDLKFWLMISIAFLSMIANGLISTFMPIIINGFGFSTLNSLLLMMPAGAFAGTIQLLAPFLAMKFIGIRSYIIIVCQCITTVAALLLWLLPRSQTGALLFAIYILPAVGGGYAVLMGLQIANVAGYTKRSIASSGLYIGYCLGNFVGPLVFKPVDAPRYVPGFISVVITSIVAAAFVVMYRLVCAWDNHKRDKTGIMEGFEHAYEDDLTDRKNPQFRYTL